MKIIIIYSGRFQPFGPHHLKSYQWLGQRFGTNNVYLATTDHTDLNSPLTFEEKKRCMLKYPVMENNIVKVKQPYKCSEIIQRFDLNDTAVIYAYGEKDYGRMTFDKKNGIESYTKEYYGQKNLHPISKCCYAMEMPHVYIQVGNSEISGTYLRATLPMCNQSEFAEIMGYYDPQIHQLFKEKFHPDIIESVTNILSTKSKQVAKSEFSIDEDFKSIIETTSKSYTRHLMHPYEDKSMTFQKMYELVSDLLVDTKNIDSCSIKVDGQNFQMTYKNGEFFASRNKSTIVKPMSLDQVRDKFKDKPTLLHIFVAAFNAIKTKLSIVDQKILNKIFNNGSTFLNFEICHSSTKNIINNGMDPYLSLHSLITYDDQGNEVSRTIDVPAMFENRANNGNFSLKLSQRIKLKPVDSEIAKICLQRLLYLQNKGGYRRTDFILDSNSQTILELKLLLWKIGNELIKYACTVINPKDSGTADIVKIIQDTKQLSNKNEKDSIAYQESIRNLMILGGVKAINPIEGLVVQWKNTQYKLTGTFAVLVPIFNIAGREKFKNIK